MTCVRGASMDSQRFDLSKRRKTSSLTIATTATLGHSTQSPKNSPVRTSSLVMEPWEDHTVAVLSGGTSLSDENSSESGSGSSDSSTVDHSSSYSTEESGTSTLSVSSLFFKSKKEVHSTDVFEKEDGYQTTRTIIRSASRSTSPPNSPAHKLFRRLDCMRSTDAFEEELDFIQVQRDKELSGTERGLRLWVEKECTVSVEEKWRSAIQAMLYERAPPADSVVGRVEVW
ncbi:hypothetical protein GALMADRAFT_211037 [Galerina marginata CBS 339.88]|uniref:Uncharacterized protein n=1 Tax=Galerina marginata (strain CBS 339.88) TaxID=685588 RepID=A0A067SZP2_GALM3|nr:hypothetical protein GALMADRAFT_211037 [Galerina marginata CBS 339.88]